MTRALLHKSRFRQSAVACLAAVFVLASPWSIQAEVDEAAVRTAVDAVYDGSDYQTSLPGVDEPLPQPDPEPEVDEPQSDPVNLDWLADVLEVVSYGLLAGAIIFVAYTSIRAFMNMRLKPRRSDLDGTAEENWGSRDGTQQGRPTQFADAEALAREGAYGEAIHALLLVVVEAMRKRYDTVRPALTARELVRLIELGANPRQDFAHLVGAAELGHFGGRSINRETYEDSHERAQRLLTALAAN
ncbi:MAG: hypothetical protein AAF563_05655 [Pseudomonadota bacterium]